MDDIFNSILGIAATAICIWLAVRIFNRREAWSVWSLAATIGGFAIIRFMQEEMAPGQRENFVAMAFAWILIGGSPLVAIIWSKVKRQEMQAPWIAVAVAALMFVYWLALFNGFFFLA